MCRSCKEFPSDLLNRLKTLDAHAPNLPWNEQIKTQKINSIGFLENIRLLLPEIIKAFDPNYTRKENE